MVVRILRGSSGFNAVDYNEEKVKKGDAYVVEKKNIHGLAALNSYTPGDLRKFFIDYSSRNGNIKDAQFHVAFSVKGNEMSEADVVKFAHRWLKEMGYEEEGQPLVIYAHKDTANTHIHIITSRIAPDGRKIDHNHEKRRATATMERLLGEDVKQNLNVAVENILGQYKFTTVNQCRAIFDSSGYETYLENENVVLKRNGEIQETIPIAVIKQHFSKAEDKKIAWRAKMLFMKVARQSSDMSELTDVARKKFGLAIVWLGKKDSPYGYIVVDHKNKRVFNGRGLVKIAELLSLFVPREELLQESIEFVNRNLTEKSTLSTRDLNYLLAKETGAKVSKGHLFCRTFKVSLSAEQQRILKANDRISWVASFCPTNEKERDMICRMTGTKDKERVAIAKEEKTLDESYLSNILGAYMEYRSTGNNEALEALDVRVEWAGDHLYCVDFKQKAIIDLTARGFAYLDESIHLAKAIIEDGLDKKPDITTSQMNILLDRASAKIKHGCLVIGGLTIPIDEGQSEQLRENNRQAWIASFSPENDHERNMIIKMAMRLSDSELESSADTKKTKEDVIKAISEIYTSFGGENIEKEMGKRGLKVGWVGNTCFCVDTKNSVIVDLGGYGFKTSMFYKPKQSVSRTGLRPSGGGGLSRLKHAGQGRDGQKRDWEVGDGSEYSEDRDRDLGGGMKR